MKTALTIWENRISPVFDSAQTFLIVDIQNGNVVDRYHEIIAYDSPVFKVVKLHELEIEMLICGAISREPANLIDAYGIQIIPFISGDFNQILNAYLKGSLLNESRYRMPGCGSRRRRRLRSGPPMHNCHRRSEF
ncbi:MAG: NifB/NifX family molybdenum-iron cluster-binding protein [Desulfobacterales bacterium]|nr:NifB/NifX family molybdenum-iron cluster-binding protein [Desulfobacterales bacterium]MDD4073004.1 NifB/NifX family molybdenum-iron cluster-binding protein [Desulfobacterales bacterium]MDD4391510.1 NifB/NifX family molybdenum-iron cluster-binding protein [Desulfobacterales bacterium]